MAKLLYEGMIRELIGEFVRLESKNKNIEGTLVWYDQPGEFYVRGSYGNVAFWFADVIDINGSVIKID